MKPAQTAKAGETKHYQLHSYKKFSMCSSSALLGLNASIISCQIAAVSRQQNIFKKKRKALVKEIDVMTDIMPFDC